MDSTGGSFQAWGVLKALTAIYSSAFVSGLATGVLLIVIPWEVLRLSNSNATTASYFVIANVVLLLCLPRVAAWIDRVNRRQVNILISAIAGLTMCACLIVIHIWSRHVWPLLIAAVAALVLRSVDSVARAAFAQQCVGRPETRKIARELEICRNTVTLLSGAMGAAILAAESQMRSVLVISGLFLACTISASSFFLVDDVNEIGSVESSAGFLGLLAAARTLAGERAIALIAMVSCVSQAIVMTQATLYPAHFKAIADNAPLAYTFHAVAYGLGALAAPTIADHLFADRLNSSNRFACILTINAGGMLALAATNSVFITYASIVAIACTNALMRLERMALIFAKIPSPLQGRVGGLLEFAIIATSVVLAFVSSRLADAYGVRLVWLLFFFATCALLTLAVCAKLRLDFPPQDGSNPDRDPQ